MTVSRTPYRRYEAFEKKTMLPNDLFGLFLCFYNSPKCKCTKVGKLFVKNHRTHPIRFLEWVKRSQNVVKTF